MTSLKFVYNTKIRAHKNLDASQFKVPGEQSRNSENPVWTKYPAKFFRINLGFWETAHLPLP